MSHSGGNHVGANGAEIVTIQGIAPWMIKRDPKTGRYVGSCDVLNLSTEGETWKEITEMTQDAIRSLFTVLYREGDLEQFLKERGFSMKAKIVKSEEPPEFDIAAPIFFTPIANYA